MDLAAMWIYSFKFTISKLKIIDYALSKFIVEWSDYIKVSFLGSVIESFKPFAW